MTGSTRNPPVDILWLGMHKTGTTFLQKSLDLSQPALRAAGVAYTELEEFRRRYTRPLLHAGHDEPPEAPPAHSAEVRRHLIFDENIPALVQHALGKAALYPLAAGRARKLADHLGLIRPRLVVGLRAFRPFLPALYCESLKSTRFQRFRRFNVTRRDALSWSDLLERLTAAFPGSELLVYTAEALRGHERALLAEITGLAPGTLTLLTEPERAGYSHRAVRALNEIARTREVTRDDIRAQTRRFPRDPAEAGFDPWTAAEAEELAQAYAADLARVATLPMVRFLDPMLRGS